MFSRRRSYLCIIAIGFLLVLFGFAMPFLMCIKLVVPSFFLSFLSFSASVSGVLLAIVGVSEHSEIHS